MTTRKPLVGAHPGRVTTEAPTVDSNDSNLSQSLMRGRPMKLPARGR